MVATVHIICVCVCECERFCIHIHQNMPDANVSVTPGALSPLLQRYVITGLTFEGEMSTTATKPK